MIDPALLTESKELMLRIAPELAAGPFYLLEHPAHLPRPIDTAAYTIRGRHIELRQHLVDRGEWQGNGSMIVLVDPPEDRRDFLALVLHETAHCLPATFLPDAEPTPEQQEKQERSFLLWAKADPLTENVVTWRGHGVRWIRRVLHLHYRALWQGVVLPLAWLSCAGPAYGLSPIWRYVEALGAEPFKFRSYPFREIEANPPPAEFTSLFLEDTQEKSK
jgi:hypothetical protein